MKASVQRNTASPTEEATGMAGFKYSALIRRARHSGGHNGFSLIEMLVAMVILALSLGALYQASAGAARNVRLDERYTYAVQIAQSVLDNHSQLPPGGVNTSGLVGDDYHWELSSEALPANEQLPELALYRLDVTVHWEGDAGREVVLTTVVPEINQTPDAPVERAID